MNRTPTDRRACGDAETRQVIEALGRLPKLPPSRNLRDEVLTRIRTGAFDGTPPRRVLRGWAASRHALPRVAAALAIVAGAGIALRWSLRPGGAPAAAPAVEAASAPDAAGSRPAKRLAWAWLMAQQDLDGRWDAARLGGRAEHGVALNSLALLALLDSPVAEQPSDAVRRGAAALLAAQQPDGRLGDLGAFAMYEHGMATVALLRAFERGLLPRHESGVRAAVHYIRTAQSHEGGWGYRPAGDVAAAGAGPNVSVSVWQIEALGLARRLGWGDPDGHLRRALFWMTQLTDDLGTVGYQSPSDYPSVRLTTTAAGLYSLAVAGHELDGLEPARSRMAAGLSRLLTQPAAGIPDNPYRDFFVMRSIAALGRPRWSETGQTLADVVQRVQRTQVSEGEHVGSWDPLDRYARVGGRLYSTSLSAMALP